MSFQSLAEIPLVRHPFGDSLLSLAGPVCLQSVCPPLFSEAVVCGAGSRELARGLVVVLLG